MEQPRASTPGDRMFIQCDGGPSTSRLVDYPPPLEVNDVGGQYVLDDHGSPEEWMYIWIPASA